MFSMTQADQRVEETREVSEARRLTFWMKVAIRSCAVILLVTGAAKLWSGFGNAKVLEMSDPIVGVSFGNLALGVGLIEIAVAAQCLARPSKLLVNASLVAWLSTCFLVYRLGLWWIGWVKPCGCLGSLTDALHVTPATADLLTKATLVYLLTSSWGLILQLNSASERLSDKPTKRTIYE